MYNNNDRKNWKTIFYEKGAGQMKDKILLFIIGVLVGAVISTGAFYVYTTTNNSNSNNNSQMQMPGGNPPSMPNGQSGENRQPPEMPNGNNSQNNSQSNSN